MLDLKSESELLPYGVRGKGYFGLLGFLLEGCVLISSAFFDFVFLPLLEAEEVGRDLGAFLVRFPVLSFLGLRSVGSDYSVEG